MNENHIEIKEQRKNWLLKGFIILVLMLISLFISLVPLLFEFNKSVNGVFSAIGGILFAVLTALFVINLYKVCKPKTTLILNAHGFIDTKNVGNGIEIEWTNVSSVKVLGKSDMPFLGICLENIDITMAKMKKNLAIEMQENIEENLPAILIAQNDVAISINELKDMFSKFAREARTLENDVPKKPKNNPFSTDDVLRAFGHLPSADDIDNTATREIPLNAAEAQQIQTNDENSTLELFSEAPSAEPEIKEQTVTKDNTSIAQNTQKTKFDNNSFYEALREKASANIEKPASAIEQPASAIEKDEVEDVDKAGEAISAEIDELLSKTKSSRIDELGKILSDNNTPFTYQRTDAKQSGFAFEAEDDEIVNDIDDTNAEIIDDAEHEPEASVTEVSEVVTGDGTSDTENTDAVVSQENSSSVSDADNGEFTENINENDNVISIQTLQQDDAAPSQASAAGSNDDQEITLESMIQNALKKSQFQEQDDKEINTGISGLATLVNDLDDKAQKKKKGFILMEKEDTENE